jgi:hypothetical protein
LQVDQLSAGGQRVGEGGEELAAEQLEGDHQVEGPRGQRLLLEVAGEKRFGLTWSPLELVPVKK